MSQIETSEYVESLYEETEKQLLDVYKTQNQERKKVEERIGMILLVYTVVKTMLSMGREDQVKEEKKFNALLHSMYLACGAATVGAAYKILKEQSEKMYDFLGVKVSKKEIDKIINDSFKGKKYSERIWDNEKKIRSVLMNEFTKFLMGKTSVNDIRKKIAWVFKAQKYQVDRLVFTELNRVLNRVILDSYKAQGIKYVMWCSVLEKNTCADCASMHGTIFKIDEAYDLIPAHANCKCYWEKLNKL